MADSDPTQGDKTQGSVFEVGKVRELVELMQQYELSELDLREGEQKIQLKRGPAYPVAPVAAAPVYAAGAPAVAPAAVGSVPAAKSSGDDPNWVTIKSPMIGTYYSRPKPDSENFVKIGDQIGEDSVVCIIEAMKVFNEIKAEVSGKIVAISVKNEDTLDFGQVMFKVDPNG
ncbi:MAG: acetyl-CoA carboxylase, biotin carboxyl carrier protein [Blastopirellula sp.]|nr:MAG: acetyl-CoA carboxylase, biotin carboxyl carrier protein [Blastopirellula sp.]